MNLYCHFPFCRRKCPYCALHSRAGVSSADKAAYVARLARALKARLGRQDAPTPFKTVYFGGGSPALCDLSPLFDALAPALAPDAEFTVELHPLDVTPSTLATLKAGGVNRVSMGVQSLDDKCLTRMGRGYTADDAAKAFARVRHVFDNAGIDLIVGYPGAREIPCRSLKDWGIRHASVYSLMLERGTALAAAVATGRETLPAPDDTLDKLARASSDLAALGLERYEISNYACAGFACRHNLAVWRGEDYIGLGEGAYGREGLVRTRDGLLVETLSPLEDLKERTVFALRTRDGLDATRFPAWRDTLDFFVAQGLLKGAFPRYRLTARGTEVCDAILADLV